jgi:thioredoxin-like negative regulator of GroEL
MFYTWFAVRIYCAQHLALRSDQASLEMAIGLAPSNADFHDQLCRTMIFVSQRPQNAVAQCKEATELNPYSSAIWLDLARAYYSTGNNELTTAAIHRALAADPTTPDTVWNVANFLLIQGDTGEALDKFATVMRENPALTPASLNICWQSLHDVNRILTILPLNSEVYLAFIRLLLSTGDSHAASQIWSTLMQLDIPLDFHQGLFYIDSLIQAHSAPEASDAWRKLVSRSRELQAYSQAGNLVTNGSFTHDILNSGFDWRYAPKPQIAVALDTSEFHNGHRSLRLAYDGNGSDAGIFQYIPVQPNMHYRLSAWVKSDQLDTANGPMLTLFDGYTNAPLGSTEETVGTTTWHRVEAEVRTDPGAQLLVIALLRHPGDTHIHGTFWVDDVILAPL